MSLTRKGFKKLCLFQMFFVNLSSYWEKILIICITIILINFNWFINLSISFSLSLLRDYIIVSLRLFRRFKSVFFFHYCKSEAQPGFCQAPDFIKHEPTKTHQESTRKKLDSTKNLTRNKLTIVPIHSSAWLFKD